MDTLRTYRTPPVPPGRTTPPGGGGADPRRARTLLAFAPGALGLAVALGLLATGAGDRSTLAIGVTAAATCYLAAGALGRPWVAWAAIPGVSVVIMVAEVVGAAWWAAIGIAVVVLVVVGLARRATGPTLAQGAALLAYGGLAVVALAIDPRAGLVVAGLTLALHAVWDVVHHRRHAVVPRSLAEACLLFDVVLGFGAILLAVVG